MSTAAVAASKAISTLRNAENSALNGGYSLYSGNGREDDDSTSNTKSKAKGKTVGAIITILLILVGGGTFLGASNSLLANALNTLSEFATNTQNASLTTRMSNLLKRNSVRSKLGTSFKNRLAANGVTVKSNGYEFKTKAGTTIDVPDADFDTVFKGNVEFRSAVISAKYGRVASFFDKFGITYFRSKILQSRNDWRNYEQTGDAEVDELSFKNDMTNRFDGSSNIKSQGAVEQTRDVYDGVDGDGNPIYHQETYTDTSTKNTPTSKSDFATAKQKAGEWLGDVSSKAQLGTDILCGLLRVVNTIAALIAVNEIAQSINYFMGFSEPTSKTMAGLGTESPINATLNYLSTPVSTEIDDYNSAKGEINISSSDLSGEITMDTKTIVGSPLESNGLQMILGGATGNKTEAKNYSIERVGNTVMSILGMGLNTFMTCAVANIAAGTFAIAAAIVSGGVSLAISSVWKFALSVVAAVALPLILRFAVPAIAKAFFTNAFKEAVGKEAGEYIARGAAATNFRNGMFGGQSFSSKDVAISYNKFSQEVIALEAEMDRAQRSPFDITSPNTFLGSIAYSMIPVFTSSKITSISSFMRTANKSIASLISPVYADGENSNYTTTFGDCDNLEAIGMVGDIYCNPIPSSDLSTIDLDPDDPQYNSLIDSTMECDENGCRLYKKAVEGTNANPNLYKFFLACSSREVPPGVVDQGVLSEFEGTGNSAVDTVLNLIPGVGDIVSVIDATSNLANLDWARGTLCRNPGNDNNPDYYSDKSNVDFWEKEGKYYQRYIEDTRIGSQLGIVEEDNPIIGLIEELEEKYQNETYTERLARQSGLTVNDVEGILALAETYTFINEYDPTNRIAFKDVVIGKTGEQVVAQIESEKIFFEDEELVNDESEPVIDNKSYIAYFNLRDRNYVA